MTSTSAKLPAEFVDRMGDLLGEELPEFLASFDLPRTRGLRLNPAKTTTAELSDLLGLDLTSVPWCETGFALPPTAALGDHPGRLAGLYYLTEPSAMSPADVLGPEPGWHVLDLAAAPGGKTTHLAALVGPTGSVLANEVIGSRLRSLHDNLDLWGASNVATISREVDRLGDLGVEFDGVLLDAPCSGEGLFRRSPGAIRHWSPAAVAGSARRQHALLLAAARLVRPGGTLVYSTCTFDLAENEDRVAEFLVGEPGWTLDDCSTLPGCTPGHQLTGVPTERTARLWPHRSTGEGQFVARLTRDPNVDHRPPDHSADRHSGYRDARSRPRKGKRSGSRPAGSGDAAVRRAWADFHERVVPGFDAPADRVLVRDDRVFLTAGPPGIDHAALARPGLPLGRLRPGRFEPHPALATAVGPAEAAEPVCWTADSTDLAAYLRGETVTSSGPDGWVLVCFTRWGLGWAKRTDGRLQNRFPRHLRGQGP